MTAKVILNPYSGRWNARKRWPAAAAALQQAGVAYDLAITERPGQATELAAQAVRDGFAPIIVASGDGTIGEVANGLAQAAGGLDDPLPAIGILPLGTANDIADTIGLPRDLGAVAHAIAAGRTRLMDLGQVDGRLFVNNAAIGLDPYVGLIQQRMRWFHGSLRYLLAALRGIADCPRWTLDLEWEGGHYRGPLTLIAIGNGPRSGGIFYTAPHADPFDGRLTVVFGYRPSRWQLLRTLPRTLRPGAGSYVEREGIT
jgi:YegS/Rv2252/BmrU family lipid kinase